MDHPDLRDAAIVWPEMIDRAKSTIDFAEFYASDEKDKSTKLTPVLAAIERAVARGVKVRFMVDKLFVKQYPETIERLRQARVDVKVVDYQAITGGIIHAKYFVVDGSESFLGSQNFDWRALEHIQEMGTRVRSPQLASYVEDVFEYDWSGARLRDVAPITTQSGERVTFTATPLSRLPDPHEWDLRHLLAAIAAAKKGIDVQVLTYSTTNRDGSPFTALDDALRAAAARGVKVRLLVSSWALKGHERASIEALAKVANVEVHVITVPPWSGGDVPFARVCHAKYAIFDANATAWVGTSNWEGDYFLKSRNVGVLIEGGKAPERLEGVFEDGWSGPYTKPLSAFGADPRP